MCRATARTADGAADDVRLTQVDLLHGAKLQLRGALRMKVDCHTPASLLPVHGFGTGEWVH